MATNGQASPLLELTDVSVHFGAFRAVESASLRVPKGEVVGLIGPNGAGKTTLMNAVFGVARAATGDIRFLGRSIRNLPPHRRARLGMARTFQNIELFNSMTVYENVITHADAIAPSRLGRPGRGGDNHERTLSALDTLGLLSLASRTVGELAYPERKLVEFARAVVVDVDLVLLDEPTAGVAIEERREVIDRIQSQMHERNVSGVVVEHDMEVIRTLCTTVYVMDGGKMIASGSFDEVIANPRVREAYLG